MRDPEAEGELAGIMDCQSFLARGRSRHWSAYFEVADVAASVAKATSWAATVDAAAGGHALRQLVTLRDPTGAEFRLRTPPQ